MNYDERIERRPNVAGGEAVIKGTRVTLRTVLASLAEGDNRRDSPGFPDARRGRRPRGHRVRRSLGAGGSASRRGPSAVRIKLDENLPAGLVPLLIDLGHEVDTLPAEGIDGEDDAGLASPGLLWATGDPSRRQAIAIATS